MLYFKIYISNLLVFYSEILALSEKTLMAQTL